MVAQLFCFVLFWLFWAYVGFSCGLAWMLVRTLLSFSQFWIGEPFFLSSYIYAEQWWCHTYHERVRAASNVSSENISSHTFSKNLTITTHTIESKVYEYVLTSSNYVLSIWKHKQFTVSMSPQRISIWNNDSRLLDLAHLTAHFRFFFSLPILLHDSHGTFSRSFHWFFGFPLLCMALRCVQKPYRTVLLHMHFDFF